MGDEIGAGDGLLATAIHSDRSQNERTVALDDFKKSIELEPQNAVWHYNLAAYYSLKQETDRGLDSLDRALTLGFAKTENTQIDLLKFDAKADPDLINLRKRRTDYCAVLERHGKFLCK